MFSVHWVLMCLTHTPCRAELSNEDDLSPDSESDTMDVDGTPQESGRDKRQGSTAANGGKAVSIVGALVPETMPQFTVSFKIQPIFVF